MRQRRWPFHIRDSPCRSPVHHHPPSASSSSSPAFLASCLLPTTHKASVPTKCKFAYYHIPQTRDPSPQNNRDLQCSREGDNARPANPTKRMSCLFFCLSSGRINRPPQRAGRVCMYVVVTHPPLFKSSSNRGSVVCVRIQSRGTCPGLPRAERMGGGVDLKDFPHTAQHHPDIGSTRHHPLL